VDHGRLLPAGEAFWDEGRRPGYRNGQLATRIRTYKVARRMDNMAFAYTISPLEMAESMAFNLDCLGCICWFEYAQVVAQPSSKEPMSAALAPFIKFYRARRDLLREAEVVADVAVLRSFPSQVLVLAGCEAMSDEQVRCVERYAQSGGKICLVGPAGTHDEWMLPRKQQSFGVPRLRGSEPPEAGTPNEDGTPNGGICRIGEDGDVAAAVRRLCGADLSLSVRAPSGVCVELTQQPGKRLLHLVNYRTNEPVRDIGVSIRLPASRGVRSVIFASPLQAADVGLPFAVREGRVEFTVPSVDVYGIAVVTTE
jgi:hypothetical protein